MEFFHSIALLFSKFWLWVGGGSVMAEVGIILSATAIAMIIIAVPFYFLLRADNKRRQAKAKNEEPVFTRAERIFAPLVTPGLAIGLTLSLFIGINGGQEFRSNFVDCVQLETKTERFEQTVMIRMCRDRANIKDLWGPWNVAGIQRGRHQDIPVVTELP